jgi:hypothetical protein
MKIYAIILVVFLSGCANKSMVEGGKDCADGYCPVTVDQVEENSKKYDMEKVAVFGHLAVTVGQCAIFSVKNNWIVLDVPDPEVQRLKKLGDNDILVKGIYRADSADVLGRRVGSMIKIVQIVY